MAHEYQGRVGLGALGEQKLEEPRPGTLVERGRRLVRDDDLRAADQRAGDGHPLLLAGMINSMVALVGDRFEWGFGLGNFQVEFDAVGMGEWPRKEVVPEQIDIFRKLATGEHISFEGKYYKVSNISSKMV